MNAEILGNVGTILGGLILVDVVKLLVASAYRRITKNDFVTKTDCQTCQKQGDNDRDDLVESMKIIKGVLLVVAVKVGVPESDWKTLVK